MTTLLDVWERARRGKHTVVLGLALAPPPQDLRVVRVSCDVPPTTLGALADARDRIERILGTSAPLVEAARARVLTGLRRHLLGDLPSVTSESSLVEVCNRLAALGPATLVLEAAHAADPASLDMLRHILGRPGWLRLPVVLAMRAEPLPAAAAALVEAVRSSAGEGAVMAAPAEPEAAVPSAPASGGGRATTADRSFDPRALPPDALRVLRALAIAGSGCETHVLAELLDTGELAILDALQRAADLGAPIEDRGEGRFHLPEGAVTALRATVLPSLAAALHRRVAAILANERAGSAPPPATAPVPELETNGDEAPRPGSAWDVMAAEPPETLRLHGVQAAPPPASAPPITEPLDARVHVAAAPAETPRAAEQATPQAAEEAARAAEEAARAAAEEAARDAAAEAARHAEEAARHAAEEARRAVEARERSEAQARRAAAEAAEHAVEHAQRELGEEREASVVEPPAPEDLDTSAAPAPGEEPAAASLDEEDRAAAPPPPVAAPTPAAPPNPGFYKPFTGETRTGGAPGRAQWLSPLASEPRPARKPESPRRPSAPEPRAPRETPPAHKEPRTPDDARAARHLVAAGDADAAVLRYFEAMQKAASAAAYPQAVSHAQAALALLDRMPRTEERRLQRVELLLEAGRVLWQGAGPDDSFTLPGALRVLETARASLHAGDPAELVADLAVTIAGVLHEIGDIQSLTRALEELSNASRALAEAGQPQAAARLFNDQASTLIRLGDPVRAAHLLTESRKIFQDTAKTDPIAMVEMAETDHLFARILLQVPARPGREDDALSLGLDHAIAAERAFRRLGAPREVGRVLETMGRIELRKHRLERAAERITAAVKLQESIGDVIGLARSTAALSEVLAAGGQLREALNLLGDSVVLNFEKGSPLGLAFNRRALQSFDHADIVRKGAADLHEEVTARLTAAEKSLGRILIPGTAAPT